MSSLDILRSLFWVDFLSVARWFKTNLIGKAIVVALFIATFSFLAFFLYLASYNFLHPLSEFEIYGQMTALYLVHASLIVTLWLGVASSFIATYAVLASQNPDLDLLLSYPVKPLISIVRLFLRSLFSSLFWSLVVFIPIGLAITRVFSSSGQPETNFALFFLVILVVIACAALGSFLAFIIAHLSQPGRLTLVGPLLAIVYIFATLVLIRYLLPGQLATLYAASTSDFLIIFNQLPLNQVALPTFPLAKLFLGVWSVSIYPLITGLTLFVGLVLLYEARQIIVLRQKLSGGQTLSLSPKKVSPFFFHQNLSLAAKDILGIIRSPADLGYALFLLFLVLGFFFFLSGSIRSITDPNRLSALALYALAWLLFYSIAYLLRLAFPLMAKEGRTAWFLFTLPTRPGQILNQKIIATIILSLPLLALGLLLWPIIGIGQSLSPLALFALLIFSITAALFGSLFPNFSEAANSEKISTSVMGLTTLVTLLGLSYLLINKAQFLAANIGIFFATILVTAISLVVLKGVAVLAVKSYQF